MKTSPAIPGYTPDAAATELALAREVCAIRLREQGYHREADAFEAGERDFSWGVHHALTAIRKGLVQ